MKIFMLEIPSAFLVTGDWQDKLRELQTWGRGQTEGCHYDVVEYDARVYTKAIYNDTYIYL